MDPPQRIIGVKKGRAEKSIFNESADASLGIIRRPASLKTSIIGRFMAVDGIVPNAALALVHFILILIVPIVTPIITFLALCEMTTL